MLRFVVAFLLCATTSLANEPEPAPSTATNVDVTAMTASVQTQVIQALRERESKRSKMSRAVVAPQQRRVRIIDAALRTDAKGETFVAFAIDSQHGFFIDEAVDDKNEANWSRDDLTGCVYSSGAVFVRTGDTHRTAAAYAGKKLKKKKTEASEAAAHVCKDKPAQVASVQ